MPELIAIKTRRLDPPRDSLADALGLSGITPQNGDILVLSSKVVAIDEGRCVLKAGQDKTALVHQEADRYLPKHLNAYGFELAIIHHALIGSAGIDGSNCGDYFTLLPADPFAAARKWRDYFCEKYQLRDFGVVITDSHSIPMRLGVMDISIGFWGFNPLTDYRGTKDLFGNELRVSQGNIPDAIAAAAGGIMGQGTEQTPAVIVRSWPGVAFDAATDYRDQFLVSLEDDLFKAILDVFKEKGIKGSRDTDL